MKTFIITFLLAVLCTAPVLAAHFDRYTKDTEIKAALTVLHNAGADEVFDNLNENSVRIAFYDISMLSADYQNHFALNTVDSFGNRCIFINTKFKYASPEELACLIAHESFHKSNAATLEEETLATEKEAEYWNKLKNPEKKYNQSKLLARLNNLSELSSKSEQGKDYITEKICNSSFYRQQLAIAQK